MTVVDQEVEQLDRAAAEALIGQICARASQQAVASCRLLELIGEFDAGGGLGFVSGVKSVAHWVGYVCSMSPGVAREHVRIARALRRMPTILAAFRAGELSYSKIREATRVVDLIDEARLCKLALAMSASQLARTVAGYRTATGTRIAQQQRRRLRLARRDVDDMAGLSGRLPVEEAAVVAAALQRARDLNAPPPPADPSGVDGTPRYADVDGLLDICRHYLDTIGPDDESGEDRSLVIVQVAADQLLEAPFQSEAQSESRSQSESWPESWSEPESWTQIESDAPPDTRTTELEPQSEPETQSEPENQSEPETQTEFQTESAPENVPAGTSPGAKVCTVRGLGGIEPETARRLICTSAILGAVIDARGDILALGRARRLVSKAQRRALMIRDQACQFPGCSRTRHLQAHHVIDWSRGGPTDLSNLLLLCRFHHVCVHEGRLTITRNQDAPFPAAPVPTGEPPWLFTLPDGERVDRPGWTTRDPIALVHRLSTVPSVPAVPDFAGVDHVDRIDHPDARIIQPRQYGERFDLHAAVLVLFDLQRLGSEAA